MSTCALRACELVKTVRANVTTRWTVRENVRANLRVRAPAEALAGMAIRLISGRRRRETVLEQAQAAWQRVGSVGARESDAIL